VDRFDAFALNIGDPYANFTTSALEYLFSAAEDNGFKLFLSMDLYAQGDTCYTSGIACKGVSDCSTQHPVERSLQHQQHSDFNDIINQYTKSTAWFTYNGIPGKSVQGLEDFRRKQA
jgi:hypothetical protein